MKRLFNWFGSFLSDGEIKPPANPYDSFYTAAQGDPLLPQTEKQLNLFIDQIVRDYALPDNDDTYDAIATMILHLPQGKCYVPKDYFGHSVLKSIANQVAYKRLGELKKTRDMKQKLEVVAPAIHKLCAKVKKAKFKQADTKQRSAHERQCI